MRLAFISDTHCQHRYVAVPSCDVLVHCGDATGSGEIARLHDFNVWCRQVKRAGIAREVVFVAGNHDVSLDVTHPKVTPELRARARETLQDVVYLQDEAATVLGARFYGSPWTPRFFDWGFQLDTAIEAFSRFEPIPDRLDVLVTHGPAFGMLDLCDDGRRVGCRVLADMVAMACPRVHAFGHIHHSWGRVDFGGITHVNASTCTEAYKPTNRPIVVDLAAG